MVPRMKLKLGGDRAFAVAVLKLLNSLPVTIRTAATVDNFKSKLKSHLFSIAFSQCCSAFSGYCLLCVNLF